MPLAGPPGGVEMLGGCAALVAMETGTTGGGGGEAAGAPSPAPLHPGCLPGMSEPSQAWCGTVPGHVLGKPGCLEGLWRFSSVS